MCHISLSKNGSNKTEKLNHGKKQWDEGKKGLHLNKNTGKVGGFKTIAKSTVEQAINQENSLRDNVGCFFFLNLKNVLGVEDDKALFKYLRNTG